MLTRYPYPIITKALKQRLATTKVPYRELHTFEGKTRPEVVIGNNAILISTLASLYAHNRQFERNIHAQLRLIAPRFWIDYVHADHYQNYWGQTTQEIPRFMREIFKNRYKDQDPDAFITWQQFIQIRSDVTTMLEHEFSVPVYHGKPNIKMLDDNRYEFTVEDPISKSRFIMPRDVFVYDWHRDFAVDRHLHPDIDQISHTILYRFPKHAVPRTIIVLGDGESVIWLAAHFPQSTIYYLSRSKERDPLERHRKPAHKDLVFDNAIKLPFYSEDGSHYKKLIPRIDAANFPYASSVCYQDSDLNISISGSFFTCIGMQPQVYTKDLTPDQVVRLKDEIPKYTFASTRNVPAGGLMDSYLRIMEATRNQREAWEPDAILLGKGVLTSYTQQVLRKCGIKDEDISTLPNILSKISSEKSKFSAMVTLFREKVSSDPKRIADFEREIISLYGTKKELIRN